MKLYVVFANVADILSGETIDDYLIGVFQDAIKAAEIVDNFEKEFKEYENSFDDMDKKTLLYDFTKSCPYHIYFEVFECENMDVKMIPDINALLELLKKST